MYSTLSSFYVVYLYVCIWKSSFVCPSKRQNALLGLFTPPLSVSLLQLLCIYGTLLLNCFCFLRKILMLQQKHYFLHSSYNSFSRNFERVFRSLYILCWSYHFIELLILRDFGLCAYCIVILWQKKCAILQILLKNFVKSTCQVLSS